MTHRLCPIIIAFACLISLCNLNHHKLFAQSVTPVAPLQTQPAIIGGSVASDYAWPWQALLLLDGGFRCGASLIDEIWVITAAHCLYDAGTVLPASELSIIVGEHNRAVVSSSRQVIGVERVIIQPGYTGECCAHDLGLLKLTRRVVTSAIVAIVPLLTSSAISTTATDSLLPLIGTPGIATGWGRTGLNEPPATLLHQVELTVTLHFTDEGYFVAAAEGTQAICYGDSGGPFVINLSQHWYLAGVASFGGCAPGGGFGAITDHAIWINRMVALIDLAWLQQDGVRRTYLPVIGH